MRRQWEQEKKQWLAHHGITYDGERGRWREAVHRLASGEQFRFEHHFNRRVQSCLDRGLGDYHLRATECVTALREKLFRDDARRHHLGDFVIMPNHIHLLITPLGDDFERNSFRSTKLEQILKSIKGPSAVACNRLLHRMCTFWQGDSYDHIIRSMEQLCAYREYIARNPALAHLELSPGCLYRAEWMDAWLRE